ncbi:MAG TPA: hypothetical protein P5081_03330 [Phycisphaerae bacterium]|nr:hypothetical protein [Phycisphaerae bacterium]
MSIHNDRRTEVPIAIGGAALALVILVATYWGRPSFTTAPVVDRRPPPAVSQPVPPQPTDQTPTAQAFVVTYLDRDRNEIPDQHAYVILMNSDDDPTSAYEAHRALFDNITPMRASDPGESAFKDRGPSVYFGQSTTSPIIVQSDASGPPAGASDFRITPMTEEDPFDGWGGRTVNDFVAMRDQSRKPIPVPMTQYGPWTRGDRRDDVEQIKDAHHLVGGGHGHKTRGGSLPGDLFWSDDLRQKADDATR